MGEALLQLEGITKRFGATVAADRLSLTVFRGEFFTLLGPSGSGKSTILRIIAGLERPESGRVLIEGKDVAQVPPWRRGLGMVFQQYALFPNMNVARNVAYGLRVRGVPEDRIRSRVAQLLALVGLSGLAEKDVTVLSGGEQQRVALARALAVEPPLLLLDEPLGSLDEKIRREMQVELKHIQRQTGTTFVYVTHDQEEALTMSDRIAVIHRGVCVQCDVPEVLFRRPKTRFVASFFRGSNVLEADVVEAVRGRLHIRIGGTVIALEASGGQPTGSRVSVAIRAEHLRLGPRAADRRVRLIATLRDVVYRGTNVDHLLEMADGQHLIATSTQREAEAVGSSVPVGFDLEHVVLLEDDRSAPSA
ncbi:MAG: ABC transporter ATP-binding protein [Armatimonadota bacterium]|nr:ABC transporter ATP-binding protein [Armatimonadota bacterium]MDR7485662.1 ABC transporter ATP-binding protein [Armatimonadota bacterium]MDR7535913.1 ABC transporter ATP-binding protein [Armatimonadota bacterium]